jgi:hypothetical protein
MFTSALAHVYLVFKWIYVIAPGDHRERITFFWIQKLISIRRRLIL